MIRHLPWEQGFGLVAILLFGLVAFIGDLGLLDLWRIEDESERLQARLVEVQEENRLLEREIRSLKNDPDYLERVARQELGMVREGEILYRFAP